MLGLAHTLVAEGLHDRGFLDRYCVGWESFERYLLGRDDGQPKDAAWAAAICGMPADEIVALARRIAGRRTLVTCSHVAAARRARRAAGLDGGRAGGDARPDRAAGRRLRLCAGRDLEHRQAAASRCRCRTLPIGRNSIADFIPVARIADMLLHPGRGVRLQRPASDLSRHPAGLLGRRQPVPPPSGSRPAARRLRAARTRSIVHESAWTATARHADIVLPATITLEREDIGAAAGDPLLVAMHRAVAALSARRATTTRSSPGWPSGSALPTRFTEGRSPRQWLEHLYEPTRQALAERGLNAPSFAEFWEAGRAGAADRAVGRRHRARLPPRPRRRAVADAERQDRDRLGDDRRLRLCRLPRPSGLAAAGRRRWLAAGGALPAASDRQPAGDPAAQPARFRRHQPRVEDQRAASRCASIPHDAAARGIADGDIVRLYNDRGACLAGAVLSEALRPGVVQLSTGAWYDPEDPGRRDAALRARQPERADPRRRHLAPGAGLHRPALPRRDRAFRRASAGQGLRPAARRIDRQARRRLRGARAAARLHRLFRTTLCSHLLCGCANLSLVRLPPEGRR